MARLVAGSTLSGYRIERYLGKGGMGIVYLASQLSLDRPIALKLIAPERAQDEEFRQRFLRESRLAASIDHPNVVPVHEAGEVDGVLFVAMRYVDGSDLAALLRAAGKLPAERAANIVVQIAAALDAAHGCGLVHRDVKPANVLVTDPGGAEHCYLTDFGLTKRLASGDDSLTRTGTVMGTVHYIAPEQLRGGAVDGRADVYALGCVLFELLAGRPPFVRDTDVATLMAHVSEPPPAVGGDAAAAFDDVVRRALEKDPAQRFQTAGDLGRAALRAAGAAPDSVRSTAPAAPHAAEGTAAATAAEELRPPPLATAGTTSTAPPPAPAPVRRRVALVAVGAFMAAAAAVGVVALTGERGEGGGGSAAPRTDSRLRVAERVQLGGIPLTATDVAGRLWITFEDEPRLAVVDRDTGSVSRSDRYGRRLATAAAGGGRLWIGDFGADAEDGRGAIVEVDPASGRRLRRVRTIEPYQIEADADSVWLTDASDSVQRVDVRSGAAGRAIRVDRPFDVALADGRAWVVANGDGELVPFDARTGRPSGRALAVGARPLSAAAANGVIWVATEPGQLIRVAPADRRTSAVAVGPPDPLRQVAANTERVWLLDGRGDVTAVDPGRPTRQERVHVGRDLWDLEPVGDGAWALQASAGSTSTAARIGR